MRTEDRYPLALLVLFCVIFAALAIAPAYRQDWLLENVLVLVAVPLLVLTYRRLRFTNFAYTCLFIFFSLHEIGAHYTYSEVPWREWLATMTGGYSGSGAIAGRNHFDRLVHFSYGLLVMPAAWELLQARAAPGRPSLGHELEHLLEGGPVGAPEGVGNKSGGEALPEPFTQPGAGVVTPLGGKLLSDFINDLPQRIPAGIEVAIAAVTEIEFPRYVLSENGLRFLFRELAFEGVVDDLEPRFDEAFVGRPVLLGEGGGADEDFFA